MITDFFHYPELIYLLIGEIKLRAVLEEDLDTKSRQSSMKNRMNLLIETSFHLIEMKHQLKNLTVLILIWIIKLFFSTNLRSQ